MSKQSSINALNETIDALELKRHEEGLLIKKQFHNLNEHLKPINLIKGAIKNIVLPAKQPQGKRPHFLVKALAITSGIVFKKYFQSKSNSSFHNLIGAAAMSGITYAVTSNPAPLMMVGKKVLSLVFRKHSDLVVAERAAETE